MKYTIKIFNVVLLALLLTNCTTTLKYNNNSKTAKYSDKEIEASIKYPEDPKNKWANCWLDNIMKNTISCDYFTLTIKNKSNKDFYIDWNKSFYLMNNQSKGTFYFEGIKHSEANSTNKPNDVIISKNTMQRIIYPAYLLEYNNTLSTWMNRGFPLGLNGAYLNLKDENGRKKKIKLNLKLSK
ncbi:hypothetical protein N9C35_03495 [Flavobacteriaceae bacterium]|nr:hypothetical protein [Flavobacteriaceae bacterium]